MIKRTISFVTILLIVLGVGIVVTRANPRASLRAAVVQDVDLAVDGVRGLDAVSRRLDLVDELDSRVDVEVQNARVLVEGVYEPVLVKEVDGYVGLGTADHLVANELEDLREVLAVKVLRALPDVLDRSDLNNLRNPVDVREHLSEYSHLAVRNLRGCVPSQLVDVSSVLRTDDMQEVPVFETVNVLKQTPVKDVLATPVLNAFVAPLVDMLRRESVLDVARFVREDMVEVTPTLDDLAPAVV